MTRAELATMSQPSPTDVAKRTAHLPVGSPVT